MHWSREACERERWYVAKAARVAPTNSSSFSLMSCLGSLSTRLLIDRYHAPAYYTLRVKGNKKTFSGPGASLVDFFVFQFRLPQNIYIWLGRDPFGAWDSHEICFFFFFDPVAHPWSIYRAVGSTRQWDIETTPHTCRRSSAFWTWLYFIIRVVTGSMYVHGVVILSVMLPKSWQLHTY
jgi:hypothetical protein